MAAIPPLPWLPASTAKLSAGGGGGGGGGVLRSSAHLVTYASALRLGGLIHLRCSADLHLLLTPHCPHEDYSFGNFSRFHDSSHLRRYFLKRYSLLRTLADAFSASCSSCFSFFSGKDSIEGQQRPHFRSSVNRQSGRLWTNVILALNIIVYAAQVASQGKLTLWGAKVNALIDRGQLWRLVTSSFLHANIGHLMVNCYSLNSIGPTVEQLSGPRRFLAVYSISAIASSLMSYCYCQSPAVGASGAIFGLVGSLAVFVSRHKSLLGGGKQDLQEIGRVIALNMVIGLLSRGIDNWGHFGGLLGGAAMSWFLGPAWKYESRRADGRPFFIDKPPVSHFIKNNKISS